MKKRVKKRGVFRLFSGSKSQVTVFIILGLILVFAVGTILYFQYAMKKPTVFELSEEPVTAYVQQCLLDITEEAVLLAGQNGGYIYQDALEEDEKEIIKLIPFNSDILLLAKQQLPYWYYQKNDGIDRIAIPELEKQKTGDSSVQDQIERYIAEKLPDCLDEFSGLSSAGIDVAYAGEFVISSEISDEGIEVTAYLPLQITKEGAITTQDEFHATLAVQLKQLYNLAREIAEYELDTLFLEKTTQNLLSIYGQVDKSYLPPMAGGLHFEPCGERVFWFYSDVQSDLREMLAGNIPYLRVANTEFGKITISKKEEPDEERREIRRGIFDSFIKFPTENKYEDITASFNYQSNYPMELIFGNNLGYGIIVPDTLEINALVANLCMFEYSFLYNLKFPVVVTLADTKSTIDGNAMIFQFPLQVIIKNNYPRIKLNDIFRDIYRIPEAIEEPSYQCSPEQALSGESTIKVTDAKGAPVEDAVVSFQCGPSYVYEYDINGTVAAVHSFGRTCFMGITGNDGKLTTTYAPCIGGGVATVKHPNYLEKSVATGDILEGISFEKTIKLDKVYTRKITLKKYFVAPPSETNEEGIGIHFENIEDNERIVACNLNTEPKDVLPYESAIITVTKLDIENGMLSTAPIVVYEPDATEQQTIDIAAGEYYIDIMLLRKERYPGEMTIEANSESIEVASTTGTKTITYPEEDMLLPQTFTGGAVYYWNVTSAMLESGNTILFPVIDEGMPKTLEQVSAPLMHREGCVQLESDVLKPRVEK